MKGPGNKFLPATEIKKVAQIWKRNATMNERQDGAFHYIADRKEGEKRKSVENLHGVSFIEGVIPLQIASKKEGEKVRILILGAGVGNHVEQIRQAFGEKVKVYSTGLSKKAVREYRKRSSRTSLPLELENKDLKWRSILEMSDYPEFDLIIDTFGEAFYVEYPGKSDMETGKIYLSAVAKKLRPGGQAHISPLLSLGPEEKYILRDIEKELGVTITRDPYFIITKPLN